MCKYRVDQHLIVLNLYSVSINKIQVTEFYYCEHFTESKFDVKYTNTVKSKVIECLEQSIRKQIDCERSSSRKQMNREQNIRIEVWKCKYNQVRLVFATFASTCLWQHQIILSKLDVISKQNNSCYIWFQQAFNDKMLSHVYILHDKQINVKP